VCSSDLAWVPPLWRFEVANSLQMAVRAKRISAEFRDQSLADLALLNIRADPDSEALAWTTSLGLAERHRLTVYDAAYLELAQRLSLPLATLDQELRTAAAALSIPLLGKD
jgi:predicted nucleic acid-binding protein